MILFVLFAALASVLGSSFAADMQTPRVTVLGSGERLSILVTAGNARLLLATGDDPGALGNALAEARHPTIRRLDVLLVAGRSKDLLAPAAVIDSEHARFVASIGLGSDQVLPPSLRGVPASPAERRFRLPEGVTVLVRWEPGDDPDAPSSWAGLVTQGRSSVAVLSDGSAVGLLGSAARLNALVVSGDQPLEALPTVSTGAIITTASAISGKELRQSAAGLTGGALWGARVYPGEAIRLTFAEGAITLPPDGAQRLSEPPDPTGPPTPHPADGARWNEPRRDMRAVNSLTAQVRLTASGMR